MATDWQSGWFHNTGSIIRGYRFKPHYSPGVVWGEGLKNSPQNMPLLSFFKITKSWLWYIWTYLFIASHYLMGVVLFALLLLGHVSSDLMDYFTEHKMSHLVTKPIKWLCAQRRLWPAWASAQSDQSLRCVLAKHTRFLHADCKDWPDCADAQADRNLRWPHSHFVGFVMFRLKSFNWFQLTSSITMWVLFTVPHFMTIVVFPGNGKYEPSHDKTNKMALHPAKISLGIRPVLLRVFIVPWRKLGP